LTGRVPMDRKSRFIRESVGAYTFSMGGESTMWLGKALFFCSILILTVFLAGPLPCLSEDTGYTAEIHASGGDVFYVNTFSLGGRGFCGTAPGTFFCDANGNRIAFRDVRAVEFSGRSRAAGGRYSGGFFRDAEITDLGGNTKAVTLVLDNLNGITDSGQWLLEYDRWDALDGIVFARWGD
jgi:hypothetical protein